MKTRILSALIMLPLLLVVYAGGYILLLACFLIGVAGLREFLRGFAAMGVRGSFPIGLFSAAALYGIHFFGGEKTASLHMLWVPAVLLLCFLSLFAVEKRNPADGMATLTGVLYVPFLSYHVALVQQTEPYGLLVWIIFLSAFGTDTMAYFSGYILGKHKLCPGISPKKTIEGSVGGLLGSVIFCGAFGYWLMPEQLIHCLILGGLGGVLSQLGDLTASVFKRKMGIKDFGSLIPGHGGILDRIDSVLFTAPMVYYYIVLVML